MMMMMIMLLRAWRLSNESWQTTASRIITVIGGISISTWNLLQILWRISIIAFMRSIEDSFHVPTLCMTGLYWSHFSTLKWCMLPPLEYSLTCCTFLKQVIFSFKIFKLFACQTLWVRSRTVYLLEVVTNLIIVLPTIINSDGIVAHFFKNVKWHL